jgi:transcriptional regulator with XRE-family HTH domain
VHAANDAVVARLREELARRRMSRQQLAVLSRIGLSTLEKALTGSRPFTLTSIVRLEQALGVDLRPAQASASHGASAASDLGAYTAEAVRWLEGSYLALRPSFEVARAVFAYRITIAWDGASHCLAFQETHRLDAPFTQRGVVSVPNKSGHVYLHTNEDGQFRLAILGRPLIGGEMYGLLSTLQAGPGAQLIPVSVPLALIPLAGADVPLGRCLPGEDGYDTYAGHLEKVISGGFARLVAA